MSPARKGDIAQRELVPRLKILIDDASSKQSTAHRDIARMRLREILEKTNWRTPYVLRNISSRRCRYIASMGFWVPGDRLLLPNRRREREGLSDDG